MKRYFITGTDTDCGKTYVTLQLVKVLTDALAIKPVSSGCTLINDQLINSDAQLLQQNTPLSVSEINPWRFQMPVSPHLAAQAEGIELSIDDIAEYCLNIDAPGIDSVLIEGAGGLLVPLNQEHTWLDFLMRSKIPVILVVGMTLGCINHALLTEAVLKTNRIECVGWIANCLDPHMVMCSDVIDTLKTRLTAPLLAMVPYSDTIVPQPDWYAAFEPT